MVQSYEILSASMNFRPLLVHAYARLINVRNTSRGLSRSRGGGTPRTFMKLLGEHHLVGFGRNTAHEVIWTCLCRFKDFWTNIVAWFAMWIAGWTRKQRNAKGMGTSRVTWQQINIRLWLDHIDVWFWKVIQWSINFLGGIPNLWNSPRNPGMKP